jgi:hypothetical protein
MKNNFALRAGGFLAAAWALATTVSIAHAVPVISAGGNWAVGCPRPLVQPLPNFPCDQGAIRGQVGGGRNAADSFFIQTANGDATQSAVVSASASAGAVHASAHTRSVASPLSLGFSREPTAIAGGDFGDELTILGVAGIRRQITIHGHLSGTLGDSAGVLLPNGFINQSGSNATADLGVAIATNRGTGTLGPVALTPRSAVFHRDLSDVNLAPPPNVFDFIFEVEAGNVLETQGHLQVLATVNAFADFSGTAAIDYILAPSDIDISSLSGDLVRSGDRFIYTTNDVIDPPPPPPPGGTVPLPGTLMLLLAGVAGLFSARR